MATANERYQEKIRARTERRAPVVPAPIVVPAGASVHDRYLAKLAMRAAAPAAKPEPKPEATVEAAVEKPTAKPEPKPEATQKK